MIFKTDQVLSFCSSQLLGDGHNVNNTSLVISHSEKQLPYLKWKKEIADSLSLYTSPIVSKQLNSTFGKQTLFTFCVSGIGSSLRLLKDVPIQNLVDHLDEIGLLLWWLDDGSLTVYEKRNSTSISRFGYLCTEGFSLEINQKLSEVLMFKFGISTNIHIDRGGVNNPDIIYYRLYLNATSMRKLIDIVRMYIPYIPKCMLYKLNMDYRPTRIKSSTNFIQFYNF